MKKHFIGFYTDKSQVEKILRAAEKDGRNTSSLIRKAVEDYVRKVLEGDNDSK